MLVYLLRHGIAVPRDDPNCPPDEERPLTDRGRTRTARAAKGLRELDIVPDVVFTSPLVRAKQTAEVVAKQLGITDRIRITSALAPGIEPSEVISQLVREIDEQALEFDSAMLVGHEPDLSELASYLLTGETYGVDMLLKKAALACIELPTFALHQRGILQYLLQPKHLRNQA